MCESGDRLPLSGRILSILAETDLDEIVSLRLERPGGAVVLTYREALYSQLEDEHTGFRILEIREICLAELMGGGHGEMWRRYQRERRTRPATLWRRQTGTSPPPFPSQGGRKRRMPGRSDGLGIAAALILWHRKALPAETGLLPPLFRVFCFIVLPCRCLCRCLNLLMLRPREAAIILYKKRTR